MPMPSKFYTENTEEFEMTNIEQKALALVNEVSDGFHDVTSVYDIHTAKALRSALCRAIEQHEALRQEVSDAIVKLGFWPDTVDLARFIIAKPDPLVEVLNDMKDGRAGPTTESYAACLRAALAKRGLEIRETKHD